jgi:uncharacterized membrane protein
MRSSTRTISIIAIFTSLIIASDYVLTPVLNVKLMDTLVFSSSFAFGFKIGASIAVLSELIWSTVTPYGFYFPIIPFLVGGELLFAFAGYFVSKFWRLDEISPLAVENVFFGGVLAICAFIWDLETNIATGLLAGARSWIALLGFEVVGYIGGFNIAHEASDFVFGSTLAPAVVVYLRRNSGRIKLQHSDTTTSVPEQHQGGGEM